MKLEVGQFVRLKSGYICKIININNFREPNMKYGVEASYLKDIMFIGDDDIFKASYNIIDILEVEDFVSTIIGECAVIAGVYNDINNKKYLRLCNCIGEYYENDIKSFITHEQMEQMAYKVGD